jgi:hypothetical protein
VAVADYDITGQDVRAVDELFFWRRGPLVQVLEWETSRNNSPRMRLRIFFSVNIILLLYSVD